MHVPLRHTATVLVRPEARHVTPYCDRCLLRPNPVHDPSAALAKAPMTIDALVVNMVMDRTTRARNILPLERGRLCLSRPTVATRNS